MNDRYRLADCVAVQLWWGVEIISMCFGEWKLLRLLVGLVKPFNVNELSDSSGNLLHEFLSCVPA